MANSAIKELEDSFNRIWVQGTASQKESAQEALLAVFVDLEIPCPEFEFDESRALQHCLGLIHQKEFCPTPSRLQALQSSLKNIDRKIASARERDITLI